MGKAPKTAHSALQEAVFMATRKLGREDGILGQDWPNALSYDSNVNLSIKTG